MTVSWNIDFWNVVQYQRDYTVQHSEEAIFIVVFVVSNQTYSQYQFQSDMKGRESLILVWSKDNYYKTQTWLSSFCFPATSPLVSWNQSH